MNACEEEGWAQLPRVCTALQCCAQGARQAPSRLSWAQNPTGASDWRVISTSSSLAVAASQSLRSTHCNSSPPFLEKSISAPAAASISAHTYAYPAPRSHHHNHTARQRQAATADARRPLGAVWHVRRVWRARLLPRAARGDALHLAAPVRAHAHKCQHGTKAASAQRGWAVAEQASGRRVGLGVGRGGRACARLRARGRPWPRALPRTRAGCAPQGAAKVLLVSGPASLALAASLALVTSPRKRWLALPSGVQLLRRCARPPSSHP